MRPHVATVNARIDTPPQLERNLQRSRTLRPIRNRDENHPHVWSPACDARSMSSTAVADKPRPVINAEAGYIRSAPSTSIQRPLM